MERFSVKEAAGSTSLSLRVDILEDRPFAFVEDKLTRKYNNINGDGRPISRRYLATYVALLSNKVRGLIQEDLPETFGVYFDGWTNAGEHFTALFGTWTNSSGGVVFRLLSCGVQDIPEDADVDEVGLWGLFPRCFNSLW